MGFLSFLGRNLGAAILGGVGIILAALGYAEQALAIATKFEPWQLQAAGALLFVFAVVKVLYDADKRRPTQDALTQPLGAPMLTATAHPQIVAAAPPDLAPTKPEKRGERPASELKAQELMALCNGKTDVQVKALVKVYAGRELSLSGPVADVQQFHDGSVQIRIKLGLVETVKARFTSNTDVVTPLGVGQSVTVRGTISTFDFYEVVIDDSVILSLH